MNQKSNHNNEELQSRILIVGYKPFTPPVSRPEYTIISNGEKFYSNLETYFFERRADGLDDRFYSELYACKWAKDNGLMDRKYTGLNHYRRYFKFMDNIPDFDSIFKKCDVIIPTPIKLGKPVREQYGTAHNVEDFDMCRDIISEKHPEYLTAFDKFSKQQVMIWCNMTIMPTEMFKKWIDFEFDILGELANRLGPDIMKHIDENRGKYLKRNEPNNLMTYQYRFGGYLGERLTNVFIMKEFKNVSIMPMVRTENKYNIEKAGLW